MAIHILSLRDTPVGWGNEDLDREVMQNLEGVLSEIRHRACGWQEKPGNHPGAYAPPLLEKEGKASMPTLVSFFKGGKRSTTFNGTGSLITEKFTARILSDAGEGI